MCQFGFSEHSDRCDCFSEGGVCTLLAARHRDLQERLQRVDLVEQLLVFRRAAQPATPIVRYEFRMRESGKYAVSQLPSMQWITRAG